MPQLRGMIIHPLLKNVPLFICIYKEPCPFSSHFLKQFRLLARHFSKRHFVIINENEIDRFSKEHLNIYAYPTVVIIREKQLKRQIADINHLASILRRVSNSTLDFTFSYVYVLQDIHTGFYIFCLLAIIAIPFLLLFIIKVPVSSILRDREQQERLQQEQAFQPEQQGHLQ